MRGLSHLRRLGFLHRKGTNHDGHIGLFLTEVKLEIRYKCLAVGNGQVLLIINRPKCI